MYAINWDAHCVPEEFIRWAIILVLGLLGLLIVTMNLAIYVHNRMPNAKWVSAGPFLGGIFCAIAIALLPYPSIRFYWFVAFIVDYTYAMFLWYLVFYSWREGSFTSAETSATDMTEKTHDNDDIPQGGGQ